MTLFTRLSAGMPLAIGTAMLSACATADTKPAPTGRTASEAWSRPADSAATGGVYLTLINHDSVAVELVGVSSPVAASAEVHESMQHDGMAHMMARASVSIGARDSVVMAPGGLHVMLNQLTRALTVGDSIPLTLRFSTGDTLTVRAAVRAP